MPDNLFEALEPREDWSPEWWTMGGEYCTCQHHYDSHPPAYDGACIGHNCTCKAFVAQSTLDNI